MALDAVKAAMEVAQTGPLHHDGPGRTDDLEISVPGESFVIPADIVSALGQGNTAHGMKILQHLYPPSKPQRAAGGKVPIVAAGGEYIVGPEHVARIGGGDLNKGHNALRDFVKIIRKKTIRELQKLPQSGEGLMDAPNVRLAVIEDRPGLIELTTQLHGENGLFPRSEGKVQRMLDRYYNREGAVIGVIGEIAVPVATIYLGIDQLVYTDDYTLVEQWNFVHPDHRRSNYARQLIAYAKHVSDGMRLPLLTGILSNKRTEAKVRLYEQMMEHVGGYFVYNRQFSGAHGWE